MGAVRRPRSLDRSVRSNNQIRDRYLRGQGLTVFIVEQNVHHVLSSADYAYVLENGRLAMGGRGEDLLNDERLKVAYMGL